MNYSAAPLNSYLFFFHRYVNSAPILQRPASLVKLSASQSEFDPFRDQVSSVQRACAWLAKIPLQRKATRKARMRSAVSKMDTIQPMP